MNYKKKPFGILLLDILEIYIPAILFLLLFVCFLLGVFFRYVIKNPQSWTFELSTVAFLNSVILAGCLADRFGEHISFDMVYNKKSEKTKTKMRIVSNILTIVFLGFAIPSSVKFVISFKQLTTPILKISQVIVFCSFPILLLDLFFRNSIRLIKDIKTLAKPVSQVPDPNDIQG